MFMDIDMMIGSGAPFEAFRLGGEIHAGLRLGDRRGGGIDEHTPTMVQIDFFSHNDLLEIAF